MALLNWINFKVLGDERGALISLEGNINIPFDIKRVYYIFSNDSNSPRGFHAHKENRQVAICIHGSCKMMIDDGIEKNLISLESPSKGILIDVMQWHEMYDFSEGCVLMVLASEYFCESDYIRDYQDFIKSLRIA